MTAELEKAKRALDAALFRAKTQKDILRELPVVPRSDIEELKRLVELLRMTISKRFPPDSIVDHALDRVVRQAQTLLETNKGES